LILLCVAVFVVVDTSAADIGCRVDGCKDVAVMTAVVDLTPIVVVCIVVCIVVCGVVRVVVCGVVRVVVCGVVRVVVCEDVTGLTVVTT